MSAARDRFEIPFECDPEVIEKIVQNYLTEEKFTKKMVNGEEVYWSGGGLINTAKGFAYHIEGQSVIFEAWHRASGKKETRLFDRWGYGFIYGDSLGRLFEEILQYAPKDLSDGDIQGVTDFIKKQRNKAEKACEVGFWVSLVGFIMLWTGYTFGLIIYLFNYMAIIPGIKTRKKGKAVAAIVFTTIGIAFDVLNLVLTIAGI